jgi:hypothetical protein
MTANFDPNPGQTDIMPAIPHRVLYASLPCYSDPECKQQIPDATIVVLQALDPDDPTQEIDVAPTRRHYKAGQIVEWDLSNKKLWEKSWYRNPDSGQIEQAWNFHVEFIGRVVSEKTLAANAGFLEQAKKAVKEPAKPRVN